MEPLSKQNCIPCTGDAAKVTEAEMNELLKEIPQWQVKEVSEELHLERAYKFPDFQQALTFTRQVGASAEEAGHHPAILTEWGKVTVSWWTHAINGLHRNDFIMASRTDDISAQFNKN